jgi:hypothetical protein
MLSKDAMRGMDIISAISDFLDEYQTRGCPTSVSKERVIGVLEKIILGARSFGDYNINIDSFSIITAETAYTEMSVTPTEFISIIEKCMEKIRLLNEYENDCLNILRIIAKNAMQVTSRRVDTKSLILH